jgi:hypothetical protein
VIKKNQEYWQKMTVEMATIVHQAQEHKTGIVAEEAAIKRQTPSRAN